MMRAFLLAAAAALGLTAGAAAQDSKPVRIGFTISKTGQ